MNQIIMRAFGDYRILDEYFQRIGAKRLFLVCGNSIQKLRIGRYFEALERRMLVVRFSAFSPNPTYEAAASAAEEFQNAGCDAIAVVGGGSAMDVAKCVKLWAGLEPGGNYLRQTPLPCATPLLAVPTTAGTGSEATRYAVVYYKGEKQSVIHENCIPSAVLLDPSALEALPDYHRKASMLDAFCHGIESFWSVHATEKSREDSQKSIQGILKNLAPYLQNKPVGNAGMLEAAHRAGKAIDQTQTTAGHAMCYKLTSLYGIAHGHAAALCVSKLWPYMAVKAGDTALACALRTLAVAMGCRSVPESIEKFNQILGGLKLRTPVPKPEDFSILQNSVNPVRLQNNPILLDVEDIDMLYHQILSGGGAVS